MVRTRAYPASEQNIGQSFGTCNAGPVLWDKVRWAAPGNILFRPTDISCNRTWDSATMTVWICDRNGNPVLGKNVGKSWGVTPGWTDLGYWSGGDFRLRTQLTAYSNSTGPINCTWGSWEAEMTYET